jgi:hypothetical protein
MLEMKASLTATLVLFLTLVAKGQSPQVTVVPDSAGWTLVRNAEELSIRGAGAKSHFDLLDDSGANSIRLWSTNKSALLDSAHQRGMTVMLGLYLRPERTGMDYNDEYAVQGQIEELKQEILKYKDHPALLIWGIGNEVDLKYTNTRVWDSVEELAMFIHQVDPNHPTSTVLAGIDPAKIHMVKSHCPSVDILGVNAYGSIEKLPLNIRRFGWEKPYLVTEWGVNGPFEAPRTSWGAKKEPPGGVKASTRLRRYNEIISSDSSMCLGSYCFLWGQKQESTATWHGLFLSDGKATDGVDAMHKAWLGEWPDFRSPSIQHIGMNGSGWESEHVFPTEAEVVVDVTLEEWFDDVSWRCALFPESTSQKTGGDRQESLEEIPLSYTISDQGTFEFTTPRQPGAYRVFVTACREDAKCSSANIAFLVTE